MTVLRIGAAPEAFKGHGVFLNGETPEAQKVTLTIDERAQTLVILWQEDEGVVWNLSDIRQLRDQAGAD